MKCDEIITHILSCEICMKSLGKIFAFRAGITKSKKKAKSSRENGKLGGRPKKSKK